MQVSNFGHLDTKFRRFSRELRVENSLSLLNIMNKTLFTSKFLVARLEICSLMKPAFSIKFKSI